MNDEEPQYICLNYCMVDQETGEEYLPPIDRTVTDAERKRFGVPALQALLARYKERPSVTSP